MAAGSRRWLTILAFCALLLTLGCSSGGSSSGTRLRVMHASPDESSLDVLIDTKMQGNPISYGTNTGYLSISSGSRHIQLEPIGTTNPVIDQTINFAANTDSTMLALNFAANISTLLLTDDNSAPTTNDFKLRLVNAAPIMGPVDIYVVAPGTDLTNVAPNVTSLAFSNASSYLSLPNGTYEIFFTLPGTVASLIDTGSITYATGQVRTIVALDNQGAGFTSVTLKDVN
jgi:hypothetical protein